MHIDNTFASMYIQDETLNIVDGGRTAMISYTQEAYGSLYGNISPDLMAGPREKCMSQCTGCKCSCSSKCKRTDDTSKISEKEWEVL